jgi:hypothetical protein
MSYSEKLHPWCIVRLNNNLQHQTVARFRRRNDAIAHQEALQRLNSGINYTVIFDSVTVLQNSANDKLAPV